MSSGPSGCPVSGDVDKHRGLGTVVVTGAGPAACDWGCSHSTRLGDAEDTGVSLHGEPLVQDPPGPGWGSWAPGLLQETLPHGDHPEGQLNRKGNSSTFNLCRDLEATGRPSQARQMPSSNTLALGSGPFQTCCSQVPETRLQSGVCM